MNREGCYATYLSVRDYEQRPSPQAAMRFRPSGTLPRTLSAPTTTANATGVDATVAESYRELFTDVTEDLAEATGMVEGERFEDADVLLSTVVDVLVMCEEGFQKGGTMSLLACGGEWCPQSRTRTERRTRRNTSC